MDQSFEEFVEAQLPRLLGLAHLLTGNPHDAWDLTQEALVRVGARWRKVRDPNPAAYVRTVLVRLNIDRVRRSRREAVRDEVPDRPVPAHFVHELDPWLREALMSLGRQQRAAVVLRTVEDLNHAQIADRLGCSVGTARSHLSRGLAAIRAAAPTAQSAPAPPSATAAQET